MISSSIFCVSPGGAKKGSQRKCQKLPQDSDEFASRNSETVSQSGSGRDSDEAESDGASPRGEPAAGVDWVDSNGNSVSEQQISEGTEVRMGEGAGQLQDDGQELQMIEGAADIRLDEPPDWILQDFLIDMDKLVTEATDDLQLQFGLGDSTDVAFTDTSAEMQLGTDAEATTSGTTTATSTSMQGGSNIARGEPSCQYDHTPGWGRHHNFTPG